MSSSKSDIRARFAQRLRAVRIPRGYKTARSFAQALDIDENRYTRYERAEVEPDLDLLMRICAVLGATPNDLLCEYIGGDPVEMAPGFGESSAAQFRAPRPTRPNIPKTEEAVKSAAWQLADKLAEIEIRFRPDAELQSGGSLAKLKVTAAKFAAIDARPFDFLTNLPAEFEAYQLNKSDEQELEMLARALTDAIGEANR